ncbi:hypothetical protein QBC46DRAFT_409016 [Diplogelasinospora grovesii]|uniref:Uncharacterized protein n=1 Tax=Diplogelasinospora grovesii TaxID=303347 RepID=A0AAN6S4E4_9PEZI|nr:hypothetical protein QBC46DRAFT_409016 [Diplogelasinospora grovesii]
MSWQLFVRRLGAVLLSRASFRGSMKYMRSMSNRSISELSLDSLMGVVTSQSYRYALGGRTCRTEVLGRWEQDISVGDKCLQYKYQNVMTRVGFGGPPNQLPSFTCAKKLVWKLDLSNPHSHWRFYVGCLERRASECHVSPHEARLWQSQPYTLPTAHVLGVRHNAAQNPQWRPETTMQELVPTLNAPLAGHEGKKGPYFIPDSAYGRGEFPEKNARMFRVGERDTRTHYSNVGMVSGYQFGVLRLYKEGPDAGRKILVNDIKKTGGLEKQLFPHENTEKILQKLLAEAECSFPDLEYISVCSMIKMEGEETPKRISRQC